jgi:lysophospholipid hydrolase
MTKYPEVAIAIARTVINELSEFVRLIDYAHEWVNIPSGRALYHQCDKSDCPYILLTGRLRSIITHQNGKKEPVGEYGRGDLVGIVPLNRNPRSTTVMAVRDTELVKLSEAILRLIGVSFPTAKERLTNLLVHDIIGKCISFVYILSANILPIIV